MLVARPAGAQQERVVWSVTASCGAFSSERAAEVREELTLACEAAGAACAVAGARSSTPPSARAHITCSPTGAPQTLDAYGTRGAHLWSVDLDGETDDRPRRAALWIARSDRESLQSTKADDEPSSTPIGAPSRQPLGLALAARGGIRGTAAPFTLGLRATGTYAVTPDLHVALAASGERATNGGGGYTVTLANIGGGVAWGAPYGTSPFGIAFDTGVAAAAIVPPSEIAPANVQPGSQSFFLPYAEVSLSARLPGDTTVRPFVTASFVAQSRGARITESGVDVARLPALAGALDVGVAWRPF